MKLWKLWKMLLLPVVVVLLSSSSPVVLCWDRWGEDLNPRLRVNYLSQKSGTGNWTPGLFDKRKKNAR